MEAMEIPGEVVAEEVEAGIYTMKEDQVVYFVEWAWTRRLRSTKQSLRRAPIISARPIARKPLIRIRKNMYES